MPHSGRGRLSGREDRGDCLRRSQTEQVSSWRGDLCGHGVCLCVEEGVGGLGGVGAMGRMRWKDGRKKENG